MLFRWEALKWRPYASHTYPTSGAEAALGGRPGGRKYCGRRYLDDVIQERGLDERARGHWYSCDNERGSPGAGLKWAFFRIYTQKKTSTP